jgi:hypothetical protein
MCFRLVEDFEWLTLIPFFHLTSDFVRWPESGLRIDLSGLSVKNLDRGVQSKDLFVPVQLDYSTLHASLHLYSQLVHVVKNNES